MSARHENAGNSSSYKWPCRFYMWKIKWSLLLFLLKKSNQKSSPLQRRPSSRTCFSLKNANPPWRRSFKFLHWMWVYHIQSPAGDFVQSHPFITLVVFIGPRAIQGFWISCLTLDYKIKGLSRHGFFSSPRCCRGGTLILAGVGLFWL